MPRMTAATAPKFAIPLALTCAGPLASWNSATTRSCSLSACWSTCNTHQSTAFLLRQLLANASVAASQQRVLQQPSRWLISSVHPLRLEQVPRMAACPSVCQVLPFSPVPGRAPTLPPAALPAPPPPAAAPPVGPGCPRAEHAGAPAAVEGTVVGQFTFTSTASYLNLPWLALLSFSMAGKSEKCGPAHRSACLRPALLELFSHLQAV